MITPFPQTIKSEKKKQTSHLTREGPMSIIANEFSKFQIMYEIYFLVP